MVDKALQCNLYVQANRQRLKQIILNLLSNAVKYDRVGGNVSLSCEELAPGSFGRARIAVTDTGAGIAQDNLKKLFTPFERLDAHKTGVEGTGLGPVLSKRLAELMGGDTGVESVVGQGSTFSGGTACRRKATGTNLLAAYGSTPALGEHGYSNGARHRG